MFTKNQLLDAIDELETSPSNYQNCEKLATFYLLYDHLYGDKKPLAVQETAKEVMISSHGGSDFLRTVEGQEASKVWMVMDELMDTIQALNPRLYNATLQELRT